MFAWLQRCAVYLLAPLLLFAPNLAAAEVIQRFDAEYRVQTDGTVLVTEHIEYDFEEAPRRGIFRTLETDHPQPATSWFKQRRVDIEVTTVTRNFAPEPYQITGEGGTVEVRIGDPDTYISGKHIYEISYTLRGALSYGTDGAELYWNATGHNWPVTIEAATVRVQADPGVLVKGQATCYEGVVGSEVRCRVATNENQTTATFAATDLAPGEGVTIAQAVDAAKVAPLRVEEWRSWLLGLLVIPLVIGGFVFALYRRQTFHKPDAPIIAQYEPYQDLLPMYTGVIFDGSLDPHDIAAGIVYLAEQGFIKIKHTETKVLGIFSSGDYELTLLRPLEEVVDEAPRAVLTMIFSAAEANTKGLLLSIKNILTPQLAQPIAVGKTVMLSALKNNAQSNSRVILSVQSAFSKQLLSEGYFENPLTVGFLSRGKAVVVGMILLGGVGVLAIVSSNPFFFFIALPLFIAALIAIFTRRRTRKGYEARFHLLGFKEFLSVTDKERFTFHNAPEKSPELFMQYLPYAIALKVEKEWAKVFDGVTIPNPDWYEGSSGLHTFSATAFASDMSSFTSSFNASSGTSGSSGGGSSGGGGGGGGGGSW